MWKQLRILILLLILLGVASSAYFSRERARDWEGTIHIAIFPINADGSPATAAHIASLKPERFEEIESFLNDSAHAYGIRTPQPVRVTLQPPLATLPPAPPRDLRGLSVVWWSLQTRWWAWRQPAGRPPANVRAFVLYHDSEKTEGRVPNSHGLSKGQIAISNVHIATQMQRANNVVIAHEILHTLGASDKYDLATLMPIFPAGFADPAQRPRYPQTACELMAGRIPISEQEVTQARSLNQCVIGPATAVEIGLTHP